MSGIEPEVSDCLRTGKKLVVSRVQALRGNAATTAASGRGPTYPKEPHSSHREIEEWSCQVFGTQRSECHSGDFHQIEVPRSASHLSRVPQYTPHGACQIFTSCPGRPDRGRRR
jgi:hypothetical protein